MKIQLTDPTQLAIPGSVYAILIGLPQIVKAITFDLQSAEAISSMMGNGATYAQAVIIDG